MAKKNVAKKSIGNVKLFLILIVLVSWGATVGSTVLNSESRKQAALVEQAKVFLEDRLYARAATSYEQALADYSTDNNSAIERQLLEVYKEAGFVEKYIDLLEDRVSGGRATKDDYLAYSDYLIENGNEKKAVTVLSQAVEQTGDTDLRDLYESVRFRTSVKTLGEFDSVIPTQDSEMYIPACVEGKWQYIAKNGKAAIGTVYESATDFSGKYAIVKTEGTFTNIDRQGNWMAVDKNNLTGVKDIAGSVIIGEKGGKYYLYNYTFGLLSEEAYDDIRLNDNGLIAVKQAGKWAILDADLDNVTDFIFDDVATNSIGQIFAKGFAVVKDAGGYFLIDEKGQACFEQRFPEAKGIEGGLVAAKGTNGKWGFIDNYGTFIVEPQYTDALSFSCSLAAVEYGGEWGYINKYNTTIIEPQFKTAAPFFNGSAIVMDDADCYNLLTLKYYELF